MSIDSKYRNAKLPEKVLKIIEAYNHLDTLRDKDPHISSVLDAALNELDVVLMALIHDEMLRIEVYSKDDYYTLPDQIWTHFASANINRYWWLGKGTK